MSSPSSGFVMTPHHCWVGFGVGSAATSKRGVRRRPDKDLVMLSSEWRIGIGTARPDPLEMVDFNVLTFNSNAFPATAPLVIQLGDEVRIRLGNLSSMSHHPIHVHGLAWRVVGTDGGPIPRDSQFAESTLLVPVGNTRTVEFEATNPGDWAMHCHMTHHTMNQMGHSGLSLVGVDAAKIDAATKGVRPAYMTMGQTGMGDHATMGMPVPRNSIPMLGTVGPNGYIDMGGCSPSSRCASASWAREIPTGTRIRRAPWRDKQPRRSFDATGSATDRRAWRGGLK